MMLVRELAGQDLDDLLDLYHYLHEEEIPLPPGRQYRVSWKRVCDTPGIHYFGAYAGETLVSSCNITIVPNLTRQCRP